MKLKEIVNENSKRMRKLRQRGYTMLEIGLAMVIVAIVVALVYVSFSGAFTGSKVQTAITQMAQVQQAVRANYQGQPTFTGLTTADIADASSLPSSMTSGSTLKNVFGGTITIAAANAGGGTGSGFSIVMTNIPSDACRQILTKDYGRTVYSIKGTSGTASTTVPTLSEANDACTGGDSNTITWVLK